MLRKLYTFNAPVLKKVCEPVTEFDKELESLVQDMIDTMTAWNGVGLAAPQIGVSKRVIIVKEVEKYRILGVVNPEIIDISKETNIDKEGCLSYPDVWKDISRPNSIIVRGFNIKGKPFEYTVEGFEARIFCHEIDHLDGICKVGLLYDAAMDIYKKIKPSVLREEI